MTANPDSHDARLELYECGLNDRSIGRALNLTAGAIQNWRQKAGLPAHKARRTKAPGSIAPSNAARLRLHRAGLSDRQIAFYLDLSHVAVFKWRKSQGLPSNRWCRDPVILHDVLTGVR